MNELTHRDRHQEPESGAPFVMALDGMEEGRALELARGLAGSVWGSKINDLLLRSGAEIVPRLKAYGKVFCDCKLHDIPSTTARQVKVLEQAGADLITLHCSGGRDMLAAAVEARRGVARLLGVTVLTALSEDGVYECAEAVYGRGAGEQVSRMTALALECGLDGIVCSPAGLAAAAEVDPERRLLRVTPGIRPARHGSPDDQQRSSNPRAAIEAGADLLVIGRPITQAADGREAFARIVAELSGAGEGE